MLPETYAPFKAARERYNAMAWEGTIDINTPVKFHNACCKPPNYINHSHPCIELVNVVRAVSRDVREQGVAVAGSGQPVQLAVRLRGPRAHVLDLRQPDRNIVALL